MKVFASVALALVALATVSPAVAAMNAAKGVASPADEFTFNDVFPKERRLEDKEDAATTEEEPAADAEPLYAPLIDAVSFTTAPPAVSPAPPSGSRSADVTDAGDDDNDTDADTSRRNLRSL
jgi:hypothetical protein